MIHRAKINFFLFVTNKNTAMPKNKYNSSDHYSRNEDKDLMNRSKINSGFHSK